LENAQKLYGIFKIEASYQDIVDTYFYEVLEILKSKWPAVETLAAVLIQKDIVSGEEATKIIEREINSINSEAVAKKQGRVDK
jgi:hypothetical protein